MIPDRTPSAWLRRVVDGNRQGLPVGLFSVCSAHPTVLRAAMRHAVQSGSMLSLESTSNQVNQFGGYTGTTPAAFVAKLHSMARELSLPIDRMLVGSDHLGPYPWRHESAEIALKKSADLARACVLAGYAKIHLDASMPCLGDSDPLDDLTVAERTAQLCSVAETASAENNGHLPPPLYVIGTEVPVPGGEQSHGAGPQATTVEHVERTLNAFRKAFVSRGLHHAWERVVGLVVQSGAEFGDAQVFDYDPRNTAHLRTHLPASPALVYEAHSTDYQQPDALRRMVADHFAILKVGPWFTFAYREAVFLLSQIERDWLASRRSLQVSSVREALESAMLHNSEHWKHYFAGQSQARQSISRQFSFSDRCRYYWGASVVQEQVSLLLHNLSSQPIPLAFISQYFPEQYERIRLGVLSASPDNLVEQHIRKLVTFYTNACGGLHLDR